MRALIWITAEGWEACVERAVGLLPDDAEVTLLAVIDDGTMRLASAPGPGRFGRRRGPPQPEMISDLAEDEARALLREAADELGRSVETAIRSGRVEHEVARACEEADLLICARDGDDRRGPHSLGKRSRFVVDHAGCDVVLVWANERAQREARPLPPAPGHRPEGG